MNIVITTARVSILNASLSFLGSIIADSYWKVAIILNNPITDIKTPSWPNWSGVYIRVKIGEIINGIICAIEVPKNSVSIFFKNSDFLYLFRKINCEV